MNGYIFFSILGFAFGAGFYLTRQSIKKLAHSPLVAKEASKGLWD
jgi:hypothetical protein